MMAARGRAQNESMQASYMRSEYLCLPMVRLGYRTTARLHVHTFELEGEVIGQMTTFVVSSQEEQGIRVPYFQRPQIQDTLQAAVSRCTR